MAGIAAMASLAIACSTNAPAPGPAPAPAPASLGGTVVAKVGDLAIDRDYVLAIARARGISTKEALNAAIDDALLAEAAIRAKALDDPNLRHHLEAALVRALTAKVRRDAMAEGPFTDEEIAVAAAGRPEVSRPESRVTLHALVKKEVPNAETIAKDMRALLMTATANGEDAASSEAAFREKTKSVAMPAGKELVIEKLPPIDAAGHVLGTKMNVELPFAKATFAVPKALGTSDVVETSYGYHVIRVLEVSPAYEASRTEKLEKLEPELVAARVKKRWDPLLARLRAEGKPMLAATDQDFAIPLRTPGQSP